MFDEGLSLLVALVDIVGEITNLERACVLLCHSCDALLHVVELVHVLSDLFVLLVHILLDLYG